MSGPRPPHLQRRNGIYHLRMRVPDRLRERVGRVEIHRSLRTYSPASARDLAATVSARLREAFMMINENLDVTPQEARALIQACFDDITREIDSRAPFVPQSEFSEIELGEQTILAEAHISQLTAEIENRTFSRGTESAARSALALRGIDLKLIATDARARLLEGFARALIESQRFGLVRMNDPLANYQPTDTLFLKRASMEMQTNPGASVGVGLTVERAIEEYLVAKRPIWARKTHAARTVHLAYLAEFIGPDRLLAEVTKAEIRAFRNTLPKLRANHGRRKHFSFKERLTENGNHQIRNKSAQLIFEPAKAFFRWATQDEGLLEMNPSADVKWQSTRASKSPKSRRPFSEEELATLFRSPPFSGCKSEHRRFEQGPHLIKDDRYWIVLIGYYSGARLGEIVQLHIDDVILCHEIPHFDLNENSGLGDRKQIKTAAGIRTIPIHPDLLELGLADFVEKRRKWKKPCKRLFSKIKFGTDGQASTRFSKMFARMLDKVGLTDPALTFHSFRHGAEDAFRNANLQQYTIDSIMGHSDGKVSSAYGEGPSLALKAEAVEKMKLPMSLAPLLKSKGGQGCQ